MYGSHKGLFSISGIISSYVEFKTNTTITTYKSVDVEYNDDLIKVLNQLKPGQKGTISHGIGNSSIYNFEIVNLPKHTHFKSGSWNYFEVKVLL